MPRIQQVVCQQCVLQGLGCQQQHRGSHRGREPVWPPQPIRVYRFVKAYGLATSGPVGFWQLLPGVSDYFFPHN
jgi:hypothetical protein